MTSTVVRPGLTATIADAARALTFAALPGDVVTLVKHCLLDWCGVALAGTHDPLVTILRAQAEDEGGNPQATLVAGGWATASQAALINGAASHALDFDDVHLAMSGHPTVPIVPALLALAEGRGTSGRDFITAFVAGFETECRVGTLVMPEHYARGFHSTATIGAFASAAACARLLDLPAEQWGHAFGIAGTRAAGLKSMFGTMCKPLHAGAASQSGLQAATLAARGFTSNPAVLETEQGFAATHTTTFNPDRAMAWPAEPVALRGVLFKYHAACYGTHATIEALLALRDQHQLRSEQVRALRLHVPPGHLRMCNIPEPRTALEGKFSLRFTAALALVGDRTDEAAFTDAAVVEPTLVALRDRVTVQTDEGRDAMTTIAEIDLADGLTLRAEGNTSSPETDLDRQWTRLTAKFHALADPIIGGEQAARLHATVTNLDRVGDMAEVASLLVPGR